MFDQQTGEVRLYEELMPIKVRLENRVKKILNTWKNNPKTITLPSPVTISGVTYTSHSSRVMAGALDRGIKDKQLLIGVNTALNQDPVELKEYLAQDEKSVFLGAVFRADWEETIKEESRDQFVEDALIDLFNLDMQSAAKHVHFGSHGRTWDQLVYIVNIK